jgi:hypothetical protein
MTTMHTNITLKLTIHMLYTLGLAIMSISTTGRNASFQQQQIAYQYLETLAVISRKA